MKSSSKKAASILLVFLLILAHVQVVLAQDYQTLRQGHEGEEVRSMQKALEFLGFSVGVDGKYGRLTAATVRAFQQKHNLEADGLAGRRTLGLLYQLAPQFLPKPGTDSGGTSQQEPLPTSQPSSGNAQLPASGYAVVATKNGGALNLRSRPAYGNTTIAQLDNGSQVRVLGLSGQWTKVEAQGKTGYVLSDFLASGGSAHLPAQTPSPTPQATASPKPEDTSSPSEQTVGIAQVYTANRGSLNLRSKASYAGTVLAQLPYLAQVGVISRLQQWTKVSYNGNIGFVVDSFLLHQGQQTSIPSASPTATPSTPAQTGSPNQGEYSTAYVNTLPGRKLNLRSSAKQSDNIIAQLPSGAALLVLSKNSTWCEIVYEGLTGFVMTSYLRFSSQVQTPDPSPEATPVATATPSPSPTAQPEVFPEILRPGSQGEQVKDLQTRLAALKYTVSINSSYDAMTQEAVRHFQLQNDLKADGIFGQQTAQMLLSGHAREATAQPLSYQTLRIDNRNEAVTAMQQVLVKLGYPLSVNGRYDIPTHQAVVAFQQRNGLPITGVANPLTQSTMYSSGAKSYDTAVSQLAASEGRGGGPSTSQVKLLHWFKEVKPSLSGGQKVTVYHPSTDTSFIIRLYSLGNHADSEPASWRDTQLMNRAFGTPSWNINTVYVKLPSGAWTLAAMHNRPHLTGSVSNNGFGGHLCIHFLRDMDEVMRNDPDYGASNQRAIRKAWKSMTGEVVE